MYDYEPIIKINNNLTLREISICDLDDILEYSQDKDFTKYLSFVATKENTKEFIININNDIKNHKRLYWGIQTDGKIVGTIGFLNLTKDKAEIGFGISTNYWGSGISNICLSFLLDYAKTKLNIKKITIGTAINNKRSINFIKKFDFIVDYSNQSTIYFYKYLS